jgi:hypothetical protein
MTRHRQVTTVAGGRRESRGSLLAEILLGLAIAILSVLVLVEVGGRIAQLHRRERMMADLREFAAAFQAFANTRGNLSGGALPEELTSALQNTNWKKGSPFGGAYEWVPAGAIAVTAFAPALPLALTRADLLAIDAGIDDGNLATGRFQTRFNGWPVFRLEE